METAMQMSFDDYLAKLQEEGDVQKCPPEIGARLETIITNCRAAKGAVRVKNYKHYREELVDMRNIINQLLNAFNY